MTIPSKEEWQLAEQNLLGQPSGTKFEKYLRDPITNEKDRQQRRTVHSFVIIKEVIYAILERIEEGGSSIVKEGITKEGVIIALKISDSDLKDESSDAYQAGLINKLILGQGVRTAPHMTIKLPLAKKTLTPEKKLYTAMELRGRSLMAQIEKEDVLTQTQKWMLSLRLCLLQQDLEAQGIVHADLKAENCTAAINGNDIRVNIVDTEFAKLPKGNQKHLIGDKSSGTPGFVALEIFRDFRYSFLSDTFALAAMLLFQTDVTCQGIPYQYYGQYIKAYEKDIRITVDPMKWFKNNVKLPIDPLLIMILERMLAPNYLQRSNSRDLIKYLCQKLENDPNLEEVYKQEVRLIRVKLELGQKSTTDVLAVTTSTLTFSDAAGPVKSTEVTKTLETTKVTGIKRKP